MTVRELNVTSNTNSSNQINTVDRFVRRREVCQLTSLPSSSLTDLISKNQFPKPFKLSERMAAWRLSEIKSWMDTRKRAGD